jgi:hypothetical protein
MPLSFTSLNQLNLNSLNEVISLTVGLAGEISQSITVMNGIPNGTPVVSLTAADKVLRKSAGCNSEYVYNNISNKVKYYQHAPIELPIEICLQSLWGRMVAKGINLDDNFSETELAGFIQAEVLKVLEADLLRLAWLDGDVMTGALGYGIFAKGGIIRQHKDSKLTEGALTLSDSGVLAALRGAIDAQRPDTLDNSEFFVTSNVMRLYKNLLQTRDNSVAQSDIVDGRPVYYFEGYKINELRHVSSAVTAEGLSAAFIAFTPKENIQLALESAGTVIAPFIQDAKSRNYYSQTLFAADAMLVAPEKMQLWLAAKAGNPKIIR